MGEKNRFSRWRRLPPVFRSGSRDHKLPGYEDEVQRLTLYLPGSLLDVAELLAGLEQIPTIQEYCSRLLARALEEERTRQQVSQVEEKRGFPLSGLDEIADDPGYLAEWQNRRDAARSAPPENADDLTSRFPDTPGKAEPGMLIRQLPDENALASLPALTVPLLHIPALEVVEGDHVEEAPPDDSPRMVRLDIGPRPEPAVIDHYDPEIPDGRAMDIVWKHVGDGGGDHNGFLAHLRRGEQVPPPASAELLAALRILEEENRGSSGLERRLAYALYRLALESQVLLTEAWPGAFDDTTIAAIRSVQDRVERILSGSEAESADVDRGDES